MQFLEVKVNVCKTKFGILGQTVCYDIRFPYLYRELAKAGAQIIFIPAVFTQKLEKHIGMF